VRGGAAENGDGNRNRNESPFKVVLPNEITALLKIDDAVRMGLQKDGEKEVWHPISSLEPFVPPCLPLSHASRLTSRRNRQGIRSDERSDRRRK
jgi:hypothetical protein